MLFGNLRIENLEYVFHLYEKIDIIVLRSKTNILKSKKTRIFLLAINYNNNNLLCYNFHRIHDSLFSIRESIFFSFSLSVKMKLTRLILLIFLIQLNMPYSKKKLSSFLSSVEDNGPFRFLRKF